MKTVLGIILFCLSISVQAGVFSQDEATALCKENLSDSRFQLGFKVYWKLRQAGYTSNAFISKSAAVQSQYFLGEVTLHVAKAPVNNIYLVKLTEVDVNTVEEAMAFMQKTCEDNLLELESK